VPPFLAKLPSSSLFPIEVTVWFELVGLYQISFCPALIVLLAGLNLR
jgi:hypothetical protein